VDITIREHLAFPLESRRSCGRTRVRGLARTSSRASLLAFGDCDRKGGGPADRARNEPRDLYDLWHFISREGMDLSHLAPAIIAKLAFRNVEAAGIQAAILKKEARLKPCGPRASPTRCRTAAIRPSIFESAAERYGTRIYVSQAGRQPAHPLNASRESLVQVLCTTRNGTLKLERPGVSDWRDATVDFAQL